MSSSSFAGVLRRGTLTQLEWLEGCASRLDADGAIFALADFPRTDAEYAAQLKKIAVDLGIVPVALDAPGLLDPDRSDEERAAAVALAVALGTPIVRTSAGPPGALPPETFARTVATAKALAHSGKAANVTIAVTPLAGTLVPTVAELKHLAKDVDSAWLRYDVPVDDAQRALLGPRERVVIERVPLGTLPDEAALGRRGWFALEGDGGDDPFAVLGAAIARLREKGTATTGTVCVPG